MRRLSALAAAAYLALAPTGAQAATAAWEPWRSIAGIVDVDGPRTDGSLVVAGSAALYLVDATGKVTDFARGPGGYHEDPGLEAYLAVSPGGHVAAAGCDFAPDDTFLLRLHVPIGVERVNVTGDETGSFANLSDARALGGIAFDTVGAFDHRLLVLGVAGSKGAVFAVDCNGDVQAISKALPVLEGQMAVAPNGFGSFGGDLIIPDEINGRILALAPNGHLSVVLRPPLPAGVEKTLGGLGFVPSGFISRGGAVYHADHKEPGSAFPGTDTLLRLGSDELKAAGVQDGDLLADAESGGGLIAVHCAVSCTAVKITSTTKAHAEGHIAFTMQAPPPVPTPAVAGPAGGQGIPPAAVDLIGQWGIAAGAIALMLGLFALVAVRSMRRRRSQ
jgi:hypothetical protein